jgi:hypothetical protein
VLPVEPSNFGKQVELPRPVIGMNAKIFALQNRKALIEANRRLTNDSEFYADVKRDFSR